MSRLAAAAKQHLVIILSYAAPMANPEAMYRDKPVACTSNIADLQVPARINMITNGKKLFITPSLYGSCLKT